MTQEIQIRAEQVIVHSEYQRDVLRLEAPRGAAATHVAPLGIPEVPDVGGLPPRGHDGPGWSTSGWSASTRSGWCCCSRGSPS